ncbi:MAG: lipocalin family protein [Proteobacteria bacterium]|nr:lipocalin family protein [Pseudomonadota bacterium]
MKALFFIVSSLALCLTFSACATGAPKNPPSTVEKVNLDKYIGTWYEQARIPNSFQDNSTRSGFGPCTLTQAEYSERDDGKIDVKNTCTRHNQAGDSQTEIATAIARVVKNSNNAKLKVNFTGIALLRWAHIGDGDYWILALGPENNDGLYSWVLVGAPKRDYGWILSRNQKLSQKTIDAVLEIAAQKGYDKTLFKDLR